VIARLQLKKHNGTLSPGVVIEVYCAFGIPSAGGDVEDITVRRCSPMCLDYNFDKDRRAQDFCEHSYQWMDVKSSSLVTCESITGNQRFSTANFLIRTVEGAASGFSHPIELLIDKLALDPIPAPPDPSTLKLPDSHKPTRTNFHSVLYDERRNFASVLPNENIRSLENLGVVNDTTALAMNAWLRWVRTSKKGEMWWPRGESIEGVRHPARRVNIPYALSSESALGCNR
jgi:hypothetical protein